MTKQLIKSYTKKDFRIDTFSAGGPGGQNQNKKQSGCRITHLPTGLVGESREHREFSRNKSTAFNRLVDLIKVYWTNKVRADKVISDEVVRTYHAVDNRVKDHGSGLMGSYSQVIHGKELDKMIESRREVCD